MGNGEWGKESEVCKLKVKKIYGLVLLGLTIAVLAACSNIFGNVDKLRPNKAYTVKFNANGATNGTAPNDETASFDAPILLPGQGNLSKNNYLFGGWNTKTDGTATNYTPGISYIFNTNTTLYANWVDPATVTFTVAFISNGGSNVVSQMVNYNKNAERPTDPVKAGYTFNNWYIDEFLNVLYEFNNPVTANITLYARWNSIGDSPVTVVFFTDGGSGIPPRTVNRGNRVLQPSDPTKVGYNTFDGWYDAPDFIFPFVFGINNPISEDTTVYAKWGNPISYTIAYDKNADEAIGTTTSSMHTYDVEKPLTLNGYSLSGFNFAGWATKPDGIVDFTDGQNVKNLSTVAESTITLYAKWFSTITFNPNGGNWSGSTTNQSNEAYYNTIATLPVDPVKTGSVFTGWNTEPDGTGETFTAASPVPGNITVYAQWNSFTVYNETEWNIMVSTINAGGNGKEYTVTIGDDFSLAGSTSNTFNPLDITVTIQGDKTISLSSSGSLLRVGDRQNIKMQNINLKGIDGNTASLVYIGIGSGTLTMQGSTSVHDNTNTNTNGNDVVSGFGGGVFVYGGTFIMQDDAAVYGNNRRGSGGGVYVYTNNTTFIMQGKASVHDNIAAGSAGGVMMYGYRGGICIFTMRDNSSVYSNSGGNSSFAGGVCVTEGTFNMNDNSSVYGNIIYNGMGGGVCVTGGTFNMNNNSSVYGNIINHGVNNGYGGGVYIQGDLQGTFTKTGGTITGYGSYTGGDDSSLNVVKDSSDVASNNRGNAVYVSGFIDDGSSMIMVPLKRKETTAGPEDDLIYDGNTGTSSGAWDY